MKNNFVTSYSWLRGSVNANIYNRAMNSDGKGKNETKSPSLFEFKLLYIGKAFLIVAHRLYQYSSFLFSTYYFFHIHEVNISDKKLGNKFDKHMSKFSIFYLKFMCLFILFFAKKIRKNEIISGQELMQVLLTGEHYCVCMSVWVRGNSP